MSVVREELIKKFTAVVSNSCAPNLQFQKLHSTDNRLFSLEMTCPSDDRDTLLKKSGMESDITVRINELKTREEGVLPTISYITLQLAKTQEGFAFAKKLYRESNLSGLLGLHVSKSGIAVRVQAGGLRLAREFLCKNDDSLSFINMG